MNKSQRLLALLMTLNTRDKFTLKQLAKQFGVSRRTVIRDLQDLEELGVPLFTEYGVHGGYRVLKERTLPPISFTENEAVAMFFASQSLENYGALPFQAEVAAALDKFGRILPRDMSERIERLRSKLRFWVPTHRLEQKDLNELLQASLDRTVIEADYESSNGDVSRRRLLPLGLYAMNGLWYCPALDLEREQVRIYRTDRMRSVQPAEEASTREWSARVREEAEKPIDAWLGPQEEGGELRLEAHLTRRGVLRCQSDVWLAQGLRLREDGSGYLDRIMDESYVDWVASYMLSLGEDARVIRPRQVVDRIREIVLQLSNLYKEEEDEWANPPKS